jgi:multimeric flavodoxin WrbA
MKVKIMGIAGSLRKGNTDILVNECLKAARELKDVETDFVRLIDYKIDSGCVACYKCFKAPNPLEKLCEAFKDDFNKILEKMQTADGFIFGCPVYWGSLTWKMKEFIDRTHPLFAANRVLRNKPAGAVTVALGRNGGQHYVIDILHRFILFHDMIPIGTSVVWPAEGCASPWGAEGVQGWPEAIGSTKPESLTAVKQDRMAMAAARNLGKRVAEMAKVINAGFTLCNKENGETEWPHGQLSNADLERSGDVHFAYKVKK